MTQPKSPFGFGKVIPLEDSLIARTKNQSAGSPDHSASPESPAASPHPESKPNKKATDSTAMFEPRAPRYKFEDLVLPDKVFKELDGLDSMVHNHELVYRDWGMNEIDPYGYQIAFNLYGPPGTGKTMIVEALCNRWGILLIDVNLSQLESKYVGDTGKNIAAAFAAAKKNNAMLFFDEADTVLGRRLSEVTQSADSSVNTARGVMLKQLEQHSGLVAFASNFAHNYDTAFVRRILKHIHVPLPDETSRLKLWEKKTPPRVPGRDAIDFSILAKESEGFSGGDILVAVKNALFDAANMQPAPILTNELIQNAIRNVRDAKENIGTWGKSQTTIRTVSAEEAKKEGIL